MEFWARGLDSVGALLIAEAMKVDAVIKAICLERAGKLNKHKRTELGSKNESVPYALPCCISIITLVYLSVCPLHCETSKCKGGMIKDPKGGISYLFLGILQTHT